MWRKASASAVGGPARPQPAKAPLQRRMGNLRRQRRLYPSFQRVDLTTCRYLSDRLGRQLSKLPIKRKCSSAGAASGDTGLRREFKTAPLISPDELARKFARKSDGAGGSAGGLTLVLGAGAHPFVVDRVYHGELMK